jgi:hypothetical protein
LVTSAKTVRLPKAVAEGMYRASVRFPELLESLEVVLDNGRMRSIKIGEAEYARRHHAVAKETREFRKLLSA